MSKSAGSCCPRCASRQATCRQRRQRQHACNFVLVRSSVSSRPRAVRNSPSPAAVELMPSHAGPSARKNDRRCFGCASGQSSPRQEAVVNACRPFGRIASGLPASRPPTAAAQARARTATCQQRAAAGPPRRPAPCPRRDQPDAERGGGGAACAAGRRPRSVLWLLDLPAMVVSRSSLAFYRPSAALFAFPMARPVVSRPKTRKGCALAWYLTSLAMGSTRKYLNWKKICVCGRQGRARQVGVGV